MNGPRTSFSSGSSLSFNTSLVPLATRQSPRFRERAALGPSIADAHKINLSAKHPTHAQSAAITYMFEDLKPRWGSG